MSWRDRSYNTGGGGNYLGGPLSLLGFSVPFGTWFGARVRLGFWMVLAIVFICLGYASTRNLVMMSLHVGLFIAAVMLHEFGHRIMARWVGGTHDEFLLWPAGGMIPPEAPPRPGPMFLAHAGGIAMNLLMVGACVGGLIFLREGIPAFGLRELRAIIGGSTLGAAGANLAATLLSLFLVLNLGVAVAAVLPYYWFDGAPLLESGLWPLTGRRRAINITCIVGMVLAVPLFVLSMMAVSLFGMLFWGMLFYSSYSRRQQLAYEYSDDFDAEIASSASYRPEAPVRRKKGRLTRWMIQRKAAQEQQEQAAVDRILEKVAQHGMHSLTNSEKRTLQRASERLREERRT